MNLGDKLNEWQEAGLIDAATAARIAAHEGRGGPKERRPYPLYAIGGLGALSVGIGLVSIVASNWDAIPGGAKLGLDFVLLLGLAAGIHRVHQASQASGAPPSTGPATARTERRWVAEILIFVFYAAVLASIGLVSQVYHLGGNVVDALVFWSLITAPIVLHGNGSLLAAVWLITTESVALAQMERMMSHRWHREEAVVSLTVAHLLSLVLCGLGQWGFLRARKPALASVAGSLGVVQLVTLATLVPLAWYEHTRDSESGGGLGAFCLFGVMAVAAALWARHPAKSGPAGAPLLALALSGPILAYLPVITDHERHGPIAALSFLGWWSLIGLAAHRLGRHRLLSVATALIGLRLLVIYFEVFGSLLDTGIGLLSGGLLTIFLAWAWVKKTRQWSAPGGGARGEAS